jgi:glutamate-ammonia-ligase adenylyltransferase
MNPQALQKVRSVSPFFDRLVQRHPEWLEQLQVSGRLQANHGPDATLLASETTASGLDAGLRRFRNREMMRIIWREISASASLEQTLADLSALAEVCLQAALNAHHATLSERFGMPCSEQGEPQQLVVLGLGKLGGRELNLSSDIDLVLCYPAAGQCTGRHGLSNEQYFTRLARAVIKSLAEVTADGFCFRVDTRLRPFGDAGPLVCSFAALLQYYQREGRDWERYALVKARTVAGDQAAGAQLLESLKPFVYRRYIDYGAVEALQEMLASIRADAARQDRGDDIKRGPGGIREIEFLVQCAQLLRGGRETGLQTTSLLGALSELERLEVFPAARLQALRSDYHFLRHLENAIQALHDQQTHSLPRGEDLQRVSTAMGLDNPDALHAALAATRKQVDTALEKSFPRAPSAAPPAGHWEALLDAQPDIWAPAMREFSGRVQRLPLTPRAEERLRQFMPMLIERLQLIAGRDTGQAHHNLQNDALELVLSICRRSAYLALLVQNPPALDRMLSLFQRSSWIAGTVSRYPALLDELIDPALGSDIPSRGELEETLQRLLRRHHEPDQQLETLNYLKSAQSLRIAVAELGPAKMPVAAEQLLTELAEVLIAACMAIANDMVRERHGSLAPPGLAIIGYGTLGGRDMNYSSDLDLVFLYGNDQGESDGARPLQAEPYYTRLTRRLLALCTALTGAGRLYEIDTRLRPNGKAGLLVSSITAFSRYQLDSAWVWEWQALVRARYVAGDETVGRQFAEVRRQTLCQQRDGAGLLDEVRAMRQRMRDELQAADPLKHAPGGLVDIDFIAQLGVLSCAHRLPALCDEYQTAAQLRLLGESGWLPAADADTLAATHAALTRARHVQALGGKLAEVKPDTRGSRDICARFFG